MPHNPCGLYILNDAGDPVPEPDTITWGNWLEAAMREGRKHVGIDTIGPYRVSTVFLALDHNFGDGPPILWETMIFGICGKECFCERYSSKAEALAGHARAVKYAESLPAPIVPESP